MSEHTVEAAPAPTPEPVRTPGVTPSLGPSPLAMLGAGGAPAGVLALQRSAGNRATRRMLQRYKVEAVMVCRPGDTLPVHVRPDYKSEADPKWSGKRQISPEGWMRFSDGQRGFPVLVGNMELVHAAAAIADAFFDNGIFADPSVTVTSVDGYGAAGSGSNKAGRSNQLKRYREYVKGAQGETEAVERYNKWVDTHSSLGELASTTPAEAWAAALKPPPGPDPRDVQIAKFRDYIISLGKSALGETDAERKRQLTEAFNRFYDWFERNQEAKGFLKRDPGSVYGGIYAGVIKEDIEKRVKKDIEAAKQRELDSPEADKARKDKWDEFYALALQLWGFSARTYPYRIPMPSEGKDILVTGDPELQKVLNETARELMTWATNHMFDAGYTKLNPRSVLSDIVKQSGHGQRFQDAQKKALQHEVIDRNEIVPEKALAAFGETVATGLLVIAVVGLFVGAEVITLGQATWILVAVAGVGGVSAFLDRREEIEKSGKDVPIPETIVHSAGDAVGVSQLIEGITGERLGTQQRLGSEARSQQFGVGTGSVATILLGSRAFRAGQSVGTKFKLPTAPKLPAGPNANVPDVKAPDTAMPKTPAPNAKAGPTEASMRASLPKEMQLGFDKWMEDIRARGGEPEKVLKSMPARRVEAVSEQFARKHAGEVARAEEAAYLRERAADNPLRPILKNVKQVGDKVWIHYETQPPGPNEIAHALKLSAKTGEPVHLFGDTASKISYPGIDGTIGNPPRPLSLKTHGGDAVVGSARYSAQQALAKAKTHGYTQVEVDIDLPGKSVAEVKAGWNVRGEGPTAQDLAPVYEGDVVAKVTIRCSDGTWSPPKPPKGPALTGPPPSQGQPERKDPAK